MTQKFRVRDGQIRSSKIKDKQRTRTIRELRRLKYEVRPSNLHTLTKTSA